MEAVHQSFVKSEQPYSLLFPGAVNLLHKPYKSQANGTAWTTPTSSTPWLLCHEEDIHA